MIGYLTGTIHHKSEESIVVLVSGVGYEVHVSKTCLFHLGEGGAPVSLEIYTHYNESTFSLFGFQTIEEKSLFKKLISVSGVGPKLGLAILSGMEQQAILRSIVSSDIVALTKISGVGKKTAERLVIELKDKLKSEALMLRESKTAIVEMGDSRLGDALQALMSLGYPEYAANRALQGVTIDEKDDVQHIIKKSLGHLSKKS